MSEEQTVKKISIKKANSAGYDTRDIGAEAINIDIAVDEEGKVVDNAATGAQIKTVATVLKETQAEAEAEKVPLKHDSVDGRYGVATNEKYGHVKIGEGLESTEGTINVKYGTDSTSAARGDDSRLSDARKNPESLVISNGSTNITYDGSATQTVNIENIGAAPKAHASSTSIYGAGSKTEYGHVKAGTGINVIDGTLSVAYGTEAGTAAQGNDVRLSDTRIPKAHTSTDTKYGGGTDANFGHVKLSDNYETQEENVAAANSVAASAFALQNAYADVMANAGTKDYNALSNKPQIMGTSLEGDKNLNDIGVWSGTKVEYSQAVADGSIKPNYLINIIDDYEEGQQETVNIIDDLDAIKANELPDQAAGALAVKALANAAPKITVLDTKEEIEANTQNNICVGALAVKELASENNWKEIFPYTEWTTSVPPQLQSGIEIPKGCKEIQLMYWNHVGFFATGTADVKMIDYMSKNSQKGLWTILNVNGRIGMRFEKNKMTLNQVVYAEQDIMTNGYIKGVQITYK